MLCLLYTSRPGLAMRVSCSWLEVAFVQGLDALGYSEHIDYDLVESTNPAFQKAIVRVNVFRDHRQVGEA